MKRRSCGTGAGITAHTTEGEPPCGQCAAHDAWLGLSAELIPSRPPSTPAEKEYAREAASRRRKARKQAKRGVAA